MSLFETGVRPIIDNYLLEESKKKRSYGDYWSASSAGYCYRKLIFERLKVPYVTEDARKQRVFSSGHIFHKWIQDLTKAAGISIAQEVELIDNELMVKGHFDDLILLQLDESGEPLSFGSEPRGRHLILYDYKTRNSRSFNYAKEPMHTHKMQLGTYMYMLRKTPKFNWEGEGDLSSRPDWLDRYQLSEARTLNIEKNNLRMAEVQYMWSNELEKEVIDYWTQLNKYWESKKMPPCTCETFMKSEKYNPFFYKGEPCSLVWYKLKKREGALK